MCQEEGTHQRIRWMFHEESSTGASDELEDERSRKDSDLEVDNGVQLLTILVDLTRRGIQVDVELALEEVRLEDGDNKDYPIQVFIT